MVVKFPGMRTRSSQTSTTMDITSDMANDELLDQRIEILENRIDELEEPTTPVGNTGNDELHGKVSQLSQAVQLLSAKLLKCENRCTDLTAELDQLRAHSMKCNIIFNFDNDNGNFKEAKGENCVEIIRMFISSVLGVDKARDMYIPVAHRIGRRNPAYTRAIIAKFPISMEFNMVMMNTNRLRNTHHQVSQQLIARQRERKQFIIPVLKHLRTNPDNQAKLFGDKLIVKGKVQFGYLEPKLPHPNLSNSSLKVIHGDSKDESGSVFTGFAATVSSAQDVSDVLEQVKSEPGLATAKHLIFAFIVGSKQNFDSDGDFGVGLHLLRHMQDRKMDNVVCVVAHECAPIHTFLGKRRMQLAVSACEKAFNTLIPDPKSP